MEKKFLEDCLRRGYSLERIGAIVDRHPSTVGYWLKKHGLSPSHPEHAPKGGIERDALEAFVSRGLSIREIAARVGRGEKTVDYWLRRYGLATERARLCAIPGSGRPDRIERHCRKHRTTTFARMGTAGHYRCLRCRAERVAARRRSIKAILVAEAGGTCHLCGYGRCLAALQFHHVDPSTKGLRHRLPRNDAVGREGAVRGREVHPAVRKLPRRGRGRLPNADARVDRPPRPPKSHKRITSVRGSSIGRAGPC
jgi:transposase